MFNLFFQILGQALILILIILIILIGLILILGIIFIKKDVLIFPKLILFMISTFYSTIKRLLKLFKKDETIVDVIGVQVMNKINKKKFSEIPASETLIFLPHCLRHRDCEAHLQENGLICTECGKCSIGVIKNKAKKQGYSIYIVPGSSFVKKIVEHKKFKSVIGVACYSDLNLMMSSLIDFYPQGVLLTKTGCFETKVDMKNLFEVINSKKEKKYD